MQTRELNGLHLCIAIMAFEFNLDTLRVFKVINDDLAALLSANADSMPICAKTDGRQWSTHFDFFDLLAFNDVIEVNSAVVTGTTEE